MCVRNREWHFPIVGSGRSALPDCRCCVCLQVQSTNEMFHKQLGDAKKDAKRIVKRSERDGRRLTYTKTQLDDAIHGKFSVETSLAIFDSCFMRPLLFLTARCLHYFRWVFLHTGAEGTVAVFKALASRHTLGSLPERDRSGRVCCGPNFSGTAMFCAWGLSLTRGLPLLLQFVSLPKIRWKRALRKISFKHAVVRTHTQRPCYVGFGSGGRIAFANPPHSCVCMCDVSRLF